MKVRPLGKKIFFQVILMLNVWIISKAQTLKPDFEQVILPITVINQDGELATELKQNNFVLFLNKSQQQIKFFSQEDTPLSVVILFDISGSTKDRLIRQFDHIKEGIRRFLYDANSASEYAVFTFNDTVKLRLDWTQAKESVLQTLHEVETEKFTGQTKLLDACYAGIEEVKKRKNLKRIVLLISDGLDNRSTHNNKDIEELCFETHVPVFCVNVMSLGVGGIAPSFPEVGDVMKGQNITEALARDSGGKAFYVREQNDVIRSFQKIISYIRYQYWVGFTPTDIKTNEKFAKIQVKIVQPSDTPKKLKVLVLSYSQYHQVRRN